MRKRYLSMMTKHSKLPEIAGYSHICALCSLDGDQVKFGPNSCSSGGLSRICKRCWVTYETYQTSRKNTPLEDMGPMARIQEMNRRETARVRNNNAVQHLSQRDERILKRRIGHCQIRGCTLPNGGKHHEYRCAIHTTIKTERPS